MDRFLIPIAGIALLAVASLSSATVITVNTVSDSSTAGDGLCSLREAITNANTNADQSAGDCAAGAAGLDVIAFNLPGSPPFTIAPATDLPVITDTLLLDGTSQPGFSGTPIIDIANASTSVFGFEIAANTCVIQGFVINGFTIGIGLDSGDSPTIRNNWIGLATDGVTAAPNEIGISTSASNAVIGGISSSDRNVISGNSFQGILINSGGAVVQGNYIGTDVNGVAPVPNGAQGIAVAAPATIGGTVPGSGNVIASNLDSGILSNTTSDTPIVIQGNFIGTDATGTVALGNGQDGIYLIASADVMIGGDSPGARNVISGNTGAGVQLGPIVFLGSPAADRILIQGNLIGTDVTGNAAIPNTDGIDIYSATNTMVGGPLHSQRNIISGNSGAAVAVLDSMIDLPGNIIQGNYLGLNIDGTRALANGGGILIETSTFRNIGVLAQGNVISGNGVGFETNTGHSVLTGNYIGTSPDGTHAIPNGSSIRISGTGNRVGGTGPGDGNLISGNSNDGIELLGGVAQQNLIQGNKVGLSLTGQALPNIGYGIGIYDAQSSLVGGLAPGAGNEIAFNTKAGIGINISEFGAAIGNKFLSNSTHDNGGLGIDLLDDGVSANGSITTLAQRQPFPVLTLVLRSPVDGRLFIAGTQGSDPANGANEIQYFLADNDPSGHGEGRSLIRDDSGLPSGNVALSTGPFMPLVPISLSDLVTADATTANGTSEFAANVATVGNVPPVAVAGPNQTVNSGTLVVLDGSTSHDPDSLPSGPSIGDGRFTWQQVGGPMVILTNSQSSHPSFTASGPAFFEFTLTVNDGLDESTNPTSTLIASVNRDDRTPPTALPQEVQVPAANQEVPSRSSVTTIRLSAVDLDNVTFLFAISAPPAHGSIQGFNLLTGTLEYIPEPGFSGIDSFSFTASDGVNVSAPAVVELFVGIPIPTVPMLGRFALLLLAVGLAVVGFLVTSRL